ncbi:hypothetical protein TIFTF001_013779 [Ficus carica]|uniref:tripeptidyl-peptidase II n=1 Tax=Ficus carica TaxID=3494 RepID=A0AA87ZVM0_FICCA|nr:hypothetical protein TIFTF001_013779 [Ficus carica]
MQNQGFLCELSIIPSSPRSLLPPHLSLFRRRPTRTRNPRDREWRRSRRRTGGSSGGGCGGVRFRSMPCSLVCGGGGGGGGEDNGSVRKFKLSESTFLASLMPKKEIGADRFLEAHPNFDGRGVIIAIFDSGVDPAAAGLQVTSDGKPKILDVIDCTGSGDIDTSKVVKAEADGCIRGASVQFSLDISVDVLIFCLQKHIKAEDISLKKIREDLQNRVDYLRKQAESYDDKGPVIDAVVWHDGEVWRVALDTQSLEDDPDSGKLADFTPLTNFRIERKYGVFSKLDACTCVVNVYDEGNVLSIVTDSSPHGTHVAGIASAFHPKEPLLNGVAPGAQLISCKIGDSRLGSMETGTGLTRALVAAVEHKCDLINMSYGEPTLLPDYGRFVDLVNEAVNKHHLIFVSSAGNSGPALSTVGAPGGTTSTIIGVGAYVSPEMAVGAHSVVEPPSEGIEYTWSSRGPTADGDVGVSISAPGGAVAPVPTWTLQRRMLMNGTSMASPSACGGIALLVSALKAEGIPVSPYCVRKALENTSVPIGNLPEDKLSTGEGLMQVDKAHEYLKQSKNTPAVWYQIKIVRSGKSTPVSRGIYLREPSASQQCSEWTVQVEPKFHEDASNLDELVPFEECIELRSSDQAVVSAPEYLLLTNNGRSFNVVVNPTNLSEGLHYYEVYGIDCKAPWRGPLFRVPITVTKPKAVINRPPLVTFSKMSFIPGRIERRFLEVPLGATWVEATMQASGFDTSRRFFVDTVQLCPLKRPIKWESVVTFSSPSVKTFSFPVVAGQTVELAIAQFWSSGMGSHETTIVDFEIAFHGINIDKEEVLLDGSEAPIRIDAEALVTSEKLAPAAVLNKVRIPYRPVEARLSTLAADRDKLPSGKQILALKLTYKFKLEDGAEVKPYIPLLNDRIYDTKFESQFYMIYDPNKRVHAMGDVYPNSSKLPKGEYNLQLYLRHDNVQYLEKLKQLVLFIERNLEEKDVVRLSFFSQPDGPVMGNGSFKSSVLVPGKKEAFYVGPPSKDKLPKSCQQGSVLFGAISYGKLSYLGDGEGKNPLKNPLDEDKGKSSPPTCTKSVSERIEEEVRDAKIKVLASLKQDTEEERSEWEQLSLTLKSEYPDNTPLLSKILEGLVSQSNVEDRISHNEKIIEAANEVIDSIDKEELAKFFALKSDPEDEEAEKLKKKMETTRDQLVEALYLKGLALAEIESLEAEKSKDVAASETKDADKTADRETKDADKTADRSEQDFGDQPDLFEENFKELKKWVDVKSKYGTLLVIRERRSRRLGTALKVVNDLIHDNGEPPKKKLYELKISLLEEIGWNHAVKYEKEWMHVRFPANLPLF